MAVVWKTKLQILDGAQNISLPYDYEVLTVAMQGGTPTLWFRCNPYSPMISVRFVVCGTGQPAPDQYQGKYIGTCFDGPYVWHVFEGFNLP